MYSDGPSPHPRHPIFSLWQIEPRTRTHWGRRRLSVAHVHFPVLPRPLAPPASRRPHLPTWSKSPTRGPDAPPVPSPSTAGIRLTHRPLSHTPCPTPTKHQYDPTIEDQYQKTLEVDGKARHVEILDTAGQDEYVRRRGEREEWEKKCAPVLEKRTRACPLLRVATCLCEASARAFYVSERARIMCERHPVYPTRVQKT